jgi:hypothetical protein
MIESTHTNILRKLLDKATPGLWRSTMREAGRESKIPFAIERPFDSVVEPIADVCAFPPMNDPMWERKQANAQLLALSRQLAEELIATRDALSKCVNALHNTPFVGGVYDQQHSDAQLAAAQEAGDIMAKHR